MSHEGEKISRREFLKAGLTAAAFLAELSIPKEVRAQLEKLLATQEFVQESLPKSIERLRRSVYEHPTEEFWAYVKKAAPKDC